jgi:hypothetical protein
VLADHLAKHGVKSSTALPRSTGIRTSAEVLAAQCPALTKDELTHVFIACSGLPARLLNDDLFRTLIATSLNRNKHLDSPMGRARKASLLQVLAVLESRSRMIFNKVYLILAFFAPTVERDDEVALIVKNLDARVRRVHGLHDLLSAAVNRPRARLRQAA